VRHAGLARAANVALDWAPDRIRAEIERRFDRERLLAWTSHLSSDVRRSSAWAIGYVGAMGDTETLVAALRHPDPVTASAAADALWRLWLETGQPPEVAAGLRRGRRLVDEGEIDEALRCFNRLIIRWPGVAEPHNQRARIMMIRKDYVGAMEDCYAALASNRYHFDALARLGECYLRLGDAQNAVRCYRQAVSINPNLRSVWRRLAQLREALFAGAGEQLSRT
jgi:tetratricopeptide (TPR) repeat protein